MLTGDTVDTQCFDFQLSYSACGKVYNFSMNSFDFAEVYLKSKSQRMIEYVQGILKKATISPTGCYENGIPLFSSDVTLEFNINTETRVFTLD